MNPSSFEWTAPQLEKDDLTDFGFMTAITCM